MTRSSKSLISVTLRTASTPSTWAILRERLRTSIRLRASKRSSVSTPTSAMSSPPNFLPTSTKSLTASLRSGKKDVMSS